MSHNGLVLKVHVTPTQFAEINHRAGLGFLDGNARAVYIRGCALGEAQDQLLERVREIAVAERPRIRAEISQLGADMDRRRAERAAQQRATQARASA
jgi:hypothetical protein